MAEQRVVILGDARIDEIRDPAGVRERVGGDAVDLAEELLGHGLIVTLVAPIGDDADGERIRSVLQDRGVRVVTVPAPNGTPRRSLVRDRSGSEIELRRGAAAFADTRRSLAAQAEADVIVDFRDRAATSVAEERDEVLRALGRVRVGGAIDEAAAEPAPTPGAGSGEASAAAVGGAAAAVAPVLLPAPIVAGTARHAPVRLLPDPPVTRPAAPDRQPLEGRLARIAT